jgi:prevent-host-death family protein
MRSGVDGKILKSYQYDPVIMKVSRWWGHSMEIAAGQFKAQCLKLMDQVNQTREEIIITKHGQPVVKLVPIDVQGDTFIGYMKGSVTVTGDIIAPVDEEWDVCAE